MKNFIRNAILIAAFFVPASNYINDTFYLARTLVEEVVPTQQSIQSASAVVGIESMVGLGSATHIGGGVFVSAHHVVQGAEDQPIAIVDHHLQQIYAGFVAAYDPASDVCIIKAIDPSKVITPSVELAWADPEVGDKVHGVGFGVSYSDSKEGCERRLWSGWVTGYVNNIDGHQPNAIRSTNPAIPGDSGGALFNDEGQLIGPIHATDYIHTFSIRNACVHKLLRRLENAEQEEEETGGEDSQG